MSKTKIYNLALNELLLARRITEADTDTSNEAKILGTNFHVALNMTLADLDLNGTATRVNLSLVAKHPVHHWHYAYLYPTDCIRFRRIQSHTPTDSRKTWKEHLTGLFEVSGVTQKVIFANHHEAVGEYISKSIPLNLLSDAAMLTVARRLASMAAPLIVGKGANDLLKTIAQKYVTAKAEAQSLDQVENFNFTAETIESDFVAERMSYW